MTSSPSLRRPGRPAGRQGTELLSVARAVFLEHGFNGTTMQEIATRAAISKTSLYREHPSKDELFTSVVIDWTERGRDAMRPHLGRLAVAADLRNAFVELACTLQAAVLAPDVVGMRRLVAAQADQFPETAAAYLDNSWNSNINALADTIADLCTRQRLNVQDPWLSAHQFTWTAVGAALNARTIGGNTAATPPDVQHRFAVAAADTVTANQQAPVGRRTV